LDLKLEVVVVPVADVDRAKAFYAEKLGFSVDHDTTVSDEQRLVQLTPPGSACSIVIGTVGPSVGSVDMAPGSLRGLQLVVEDIRAVHADLGGRGVDVGEVQVYDRGSRSLRPSREGDTLDNVGFVFFSDPDGNTWTVQQISSRR
jgi:catechol 2,3-dioxygenase-like lactoylglutathione lyase family enzyme